MKPLLSVFVDGLTPESVEHMPFVRAFSHRARIRTELGYSVTCDSSMYCGVRPNRHLKWFIWQRGDDAMYRWTRSFARHPGSNLMVTAYVAYRLSKMFDHSNTSFYGVKYITGTCFRYWPEFEMVEKKLWTEPGFLEEFPTVFDVLREHDVPFLVSGLRRFGGASSLQQVREDSFSELNPWTFVFIGDVDGLTHKAGPESEEAKALLGDVDAQLRRIYDELSSHGEDPTFLLWSDHGMTRVDKTFDIKEAFKNRGQNLAKFCHMIDNNFARFWFKNDDERSQVERVLEDIDAGYIITDQIAKKYAVDMPDNRYGDLVFYLDLPYAFGRAWYPLGVSSATKPYHHGYSPDHRSMDGVLVASEPLKGDKKGVELCDIMPSILDSLGVSVPEYVDGRSLWQRS